MSAGRRIRVAHAALTAALLAGATIASADSAPAPAADPTCDAAEYRQFDFWVGHWDVYPLEQPGRKVAESLIESLYQGCAIRENWMPLKGHTGGSLSAYDRTIGQWRQSWTDASGSWADFRGGWNGTAFVLEGRWPQPGAPRQITRMTYTRLPDGKVEQRGQTSDDEGKTFQDSWGFVYVPAAR